MDEPNQEIVVRPNRLTIVEKVYLETEEGTEQVDSISERLLESLEDEIYSRNMKVSTSWMELDTGFIGNDASLIIIQNKGGARLDVSFNRGESIHCFLPENESLRVVPIHPDLIRVQSLSLTKITVVSFPS